ncbi:hypothetical protein [Arthrobacter crusticola]|nr:hypothetical protein [Arthrobacter crusticola]
MLKRILWALAPIVVSKVMQKRGGAQSRRPGSYNRADKTRYGKNFGR